MLLSTLPHEIHHEIFQYLDYVRDICRWKPLMIPCFNITQWTREEFENMIDSSDEITLDRFNGDLNKEPLCLTCKGLYQSIRSFKPLSVHIKVQDNVSKPQYEIDARYRSKLQGFPWLGLKDTRLNNHATDIWVNTFKEFINKKKRFCSNYPFDRVEHVEFWSCQPKYFTRVDINELVTYFFNIKCINVNFEGFFSKIWPHYRLIQCEHVGRVFVGPNLFHNSKSTRIGVDDLHCILSPGYILNIESHLFNAVATKNRKVVEFILNRYFINVDHFSFLCNIHSSLYRSGGTIFDLEGVLPLLEKIYIRYTKFKIFNIPISSIAHLRLIQKYPFIDITISKNITVHFLEQVLKHYENTLHFCQENNLDLSKLGRYQCSALVLVSHKHNTLDENSQDKFGIPAYVFLGDQISPSWNLTLRDNFGNNFLHYYFIRVYGFGTRFDLYESNSELANLEYQENDLGVRPSEIAIFNAWKVEGFTKFHKTFNYFNFEKMVNNSICNHLHGLCIGLDELFMTYRSDLPQGSTKSSIIGKDINGRVPIHYFQRFSLLTTPKYLEYMFEKDVNGTIPAQLNSLRFGSLLDDIATVENMPVFNFVSHVDEFGFIRIMYLSLKSDPLSILSLLEECNSIGFDYSITGLTQLVSLLVYHDGECFCCSIETKELKRVKNASHLGCLDGDDISHFFVRRFLKDMDNYMHIMEALILRGLKLDLVKNSSGKTAWNLIEEYGKPLKNNFFTRFKSICRKGTTKSKALPKFHINYSQKLLANNLIMEQSDTCLKFKGTSISQYNIRLKRKLYFPKKLPPTTTR